MPPGVPVGAVERPFLVLGVEPELRDENFDPFRWLFVDSPLLEESYLVSPDSVIEPHLISDMRRDPLLTVL